MWPTGGEEVYTADGSSLVVSQSVPGALGMQVEVWSDDPVTCNKNNSFLPVQNDSLAVFSCSRTSSREDFQPLCQKRGSSFGSSPISGGSLHEGKYENMQEERTDSSSSTEFTLLERKTMQTSLSVYANASIPEEVGESTGDRAVESLQVSYLQDDMGCSMQIVKFGDISSSVWTVEGEQIEANEGGRVGGGVVEGDGKATSQPAIAMFGDMLLSSVGTFLGEAFGAKEGGRVGGGSAAPSSLVQGDSQPQSVYHTHSNQEGAGDEHLVRGAGFDDPTLDIDKSVRLASLHTSQSPQIVMCGDIIYNCEQSYLE